MRKNLACSLSMNPFTPHDLPSPWPPWPWYYSLLRGWRNLLQPVAYCPLFFGILYILQGFTDKVPAWMRNRPFLICLKEGFQKTYSRPSQTFLFSLSMNFKRYSYITIQSRPFDAIDASSSGRLTCLSLRHFGWIQHVCAHIVRLRTFLLKWS